MKRCLSCKGLFEAAPWQCPACGWQPVFIDGRPAFAPGIVDENAGFSSEYFETLARNESQHFWFESRNRLLCWALSRYFPAMRSILEIGCGTGFVLTGIGRRFPAVRLYGSEVFRNGLLCAARRLPNAELFQMDAREIPFEAEFDVVGAFDVLEHIEEDGAVLEQMYRAAKPGGGILLTVPQHPSLWSAADDYSYHKRRYTREELVSKVRRAGFTPVRTTSFVTLLLPAFIAARRRMKSTEEFDPEAGFGMNPMLNNLLTGVLSLERGLIRMGASLPVGSSLLLVGRRD